MAGTHKVKQGETLCSIAQTHGCANWHAVYDDAANADLRARRANPNVLDPGDVVTIPESPPEAGVAVPLDKRTVLVRYRRGEQVLRLFMTDAAWQPRANEAYKLTFEGGERSGTCDAKGILRTTIPVGMQQAELQVGNDRWTLQVAHLNPIEADTSDAGASGCKGRLSNLGYAVKQVEGPLDDEDHALLRRFQTTVGLEVTGKLDDATRARIMSLHGS
jgi:hypothetical protein